MRIYVDSIDAVPGTVLSAARLRQILELVPAEWLTNVTEAHITASRVPANSRWRHSDASFSPYDQRLTVFARECTPQQLVNPILTSLAAHHLGFSPRRSGYFSAVDARRISQVIAPHAEEIIRRVFPRSSVLPTDATVKRTTE